MAFHQWTSVKVVNCQDEVLRRTPVTEANGKKPRSLLTFGLND